MFSQMILYLEMLISLVVQERVLPDIPLDRVALPDVYLVKAQAITGTSHKILHVYTGPEIIKGKAFFGEIYDIENAQSLAQKKVTMHLAKGGVGIWWIKKENGEMLSVFGQLLQLPPDRVCFFSALRDGTKNGEVKYEIAVVKAEIIEKFFRANEKGRFKVIDDVVKTRDSIKSATALMLLRNSQEKKDSRVANYVLPLSKDDSLSPRVQWEVEQLLVYNKEAWKGSADEKKNGGSLVHGALEGKAEFAMGIFR